MQGLAKRIGLAVLGLMIAATVSQAGTILSVSGPETGAYTIGAATPIPSVEILAVSWSQTQPYSDVAVSAWLNATQAGNTVDAYLMQGNLPQPVPNQVAHSTVSIAAGNGDYTLFSGLTLAAGTYSLVLDSFTSQPNGVGWLYTESPTIVKDTGVVLPHALYDSVPNPSSQPSYPPGYPNYKFSDSIGNLEFSVASVPEPASLVMLSLGLAAVAGVASPRYRSNLK